MSDEKHNTGICNLGSFNTGNDNPGSYNTGYYNPGYHNTGYHNPGSWNSGSWNDCDNETGFFNTSNSETIRVFNKECKRSDWKKAKKPDFLYFNLAYVEDDQLKALDYKEAFRKSFESAKLKSDWEEQRELLLNLPNFDFEIFEQISGITKDEILGGHK